MRLCFLMKRFNYHLEDPTPENCQAAIMVLLELYNLSSRLDVKNAALHVLDLQSQAINQADGVQGADSAHILKILATLDEKSKRLHSFRGQLGQHLKTHSFLNALRQRASIAGGINGLDIPLFNYWLYQPDTKRVEDLRTWVRPYEIAFEAIQILMDFIYQGIDEQTIVAESGFYQSPLNHDKNYQILAIEIPDNTRVYPEISAGKQRFSVRFVDASSLEEKGKQITDNVEFKLTLYSF